VVSALLAVWPLPNTMAFRHLLLLTGTVVALRVLFLNRAWLADNGNWNIWLLGSFFLWLVFHYFALSTNSEEQLYELKGDWLRTLLATTIGLTLGFMLTRAPDQKKSLLLEGMFLAGLSGTVAIYVARYLYEVVHTGEAIHKDFYMAPYLGKTPLVVFGSIFLCGLFAKLSSGLAGRERSLWLILTGVSIVCVSITYFFANTKNGFIVFIFIFSVYAFRLLRTQSRSKLADKLAFVFILLALAGFLKGHIEENPSWLNFYSDFKAGRDIEHNFNWKNAEKYPLPINDRGQTANASTYERSAWATAGFELVSEHPLGYGLINHSFGALALEKWPDFYKPVGKYRHASHSGWLDFTLGFGIPGLVLVLLPMWVSFRRAAGRVGFWFEFVRWSVPVITIVYAITEVCTGHFIEFLFFYVALIAGLTARKKAI
jgi:hypothetical protein